MASWRRPAILIAAAVLALLSLVYLGVYAASRAWVGSDIANRVAFTEIDDREVAVFAYVGDGPAGVLDLPRYMREPKRERAAAIDTATREVLWDTPVVDYYGVQNPGVLAADERYAYLATERGLAIVETATGDVHAGIDEVEGIGEKRITDVSAYDYDEATDSVVVLLPGGEVRTIRVGEDTAATASATVTERWARALEDTERDLFDNAVPGLDDGIDSPSGIRIRAVPQPGLDELLFHTQPSDGGCYDEVCYNDEDGTAAVIGDSPFWSL